MITIGTGRGVGEYRASGRLHILTCRQDYESIRVGDIIVIPRADSELVLWLDKITGIISLAGGVAAHLALIALEAGIPYLVLSTGHESLTDGLRVVIDPVHGTIEA